VANSGVVPLVPGVSGVLVGRTVRCDARAGRFCVGINRRAGKLVCRARSIRPIVPATKVGCQRDRLSIFRSRRPVRRLAAILIADVAGYSRLMDQDEQGTHARIRLLHSRVVEPSIARHAGHVVRLVGDGMLVVFASATEALRCAVEMQHETVARSKSVPASDRICFRVGINVADILIDEKDIAGGGVNLTARLETLAEPGGICVSQALKEQIYEDIGVAYVDAGLRRVKNIGRPVRVFRVVCRPQQALAHVRAYVDRIALRTTLPWAIATALASVVVVLSTLLYVESGSERPEIRLSTSQTARAAAAPDTRRQVPGRAHQLARWIGMPFRQ
jgi:class 3 adenylate cyclase